MTSNFQSPNAHTLPIGPQIPGRQRKPRIDFNDEVREKVLTLLASGVSRRSAARFVGCSASTITRAAQRDPDFGARVARAESMLELEALQRVRKAAEEPRYWRAAAWLLERRCAQDYAVQPRERYPSLLLAKAWNEMFSLLVDDLPADRCRRIVKKLHEVMLDVEPNWIPDPWEGDLLDDTIDDVHGPEQPSQQAADNAAVQAAQPSTQAAADRSAHAADRSAHAAEPAQDRAEPSTPSGRPSANRAEQRAKPTQPAPASDDLDEDREDDEDDESQSQCDSDEDYGWFDDPDPCEQSDDFERFLAPQSP